MILVESQDQVQAIIDTSVAGYVPTSRTVNGHALSGNVSVSAADVGAPSGSGTSSGTNTGDQTIPVGGTPALTLGTTNTAGVSPNFLRRDDTVLAFDATAPTTQAFSDSAVVGVATVAARRDHKHAMMAAPTSVSGNAGTVTNGVYTTDTGTVTNTMLAGSITNDKLSNGAVANLSGTNTGDQTSIVGITGTTAQFNTALTDADFATGGGTATGTNTGDQTISDATITTTDITTNNVSTLKHGFMSKLPGGTTTYYRADGTFATVSASAATFNPNLQTSSANQTVPTNSSVFLFRKYTLTGTAQCLNSGFLIIKN